MVRLLVHGSGFARPFKSDPAELRCGKPKEVKGNPNCHWSPATIDWQELGRKSGGSTPAGTVAELVKVIGDQAVESIDELRIIGHSNGVFLALGGTVKPDMVEFTEDAMIGRSATFLTAVPRLRSLQDRFKADAKVVLAGCGSGGIGSDLLELASLTFIRTVAGFKEPILYAIDGTTRGPEVRLSDGTVTRRIDDDARITGRGKAMYSTAANTIEDRLGSNFVGTGVLQTDAWLLEPDATSSAGNIFGAAARFKANPSTIPAAEVGYKLLRAFHPTQATFVPGIGYAGNVAGIKVVTTGNSRDKFLLEIGKGFFDRLSPRTLHLRVAELQQATAMLRDRQTGLVPVKAG